MKNMIKWAIVILVIMVVAVLLTKITARTQANKIGKEKLERTPNPRLVTLDSLPFSLGSLSEKPLVLIHFNSECEHCHYEIEEMKSHFNEFKNTNVVWFSIEPIHKILAFRNTYLMNDVSNIVFTKLNAEDAAVTFGALAVPHIFIYGADGYLIKEFRGETKAEAILKHLNSK